MLKFSMYSDTFEGIPLLRNGVGTAVMKEYLPVKEYQDIFMSDFCEKLVREIDKSEILSPGAISSPVLGVIPADKLSGGTSLLISILFLIHSNKEFYFKSSGMGDNCIKYLFEIAEKYDLNMFMSHDYPRIYQDNLLYCLDEDRFITSQEDLKRTYLTHHCNYIKSCEID